MAIYRTVHTTFLGVSKVLDDMTPEDRYFMLYLLTNTHTNMAGCYEVSKRTISNETGYTIETVEKLLDRFENILKLVRYSKETKEILVLNWYKYNWTSSNKVRTRIEEDIETIKNEEFKEYLNTVCIPYIYGTDTVSDEAELYPTDRVSIRYGYNKHNTNTTQTQHNSITK